MLKAVKYSCKIWCDSNYRLYWSLVYKKKKRKGKVGKNSRFSFMHAVTESGKLPSVRIHQRWQWPWQTNTKTNSHINKKSSHFQNNQQIQCTFPSQVPFPLQQKYKEKAKQNITILSCICEGFLFENNVSLELLCCKFSNMYC